jgi:RNA polymerase sigma factor (sigma-70 family)
VTGLVVAASRASTGRYALQRDSRPATWAGSHLRRAGEADLASAPVKPEREGDTSDVASLVRRAAEGDRWAWERLVDKYAQLIWAMTRDFRLMESDAADVVQVTWLRLLEHIDRLEQPARVGSWLAATARRECLRSLAARKRMVPVSDDATLDGVATHQPAVDEGLLADERAQAVREALSHLPRRWQRLIELLMADPPASYTEISDQLGLPVGSIGPTRGRCLARLRVLLQASLAPRRGLAEHARRCWRDWSRPPTSVGRLYFRVSQATSSSGTSSGHRRHLAGARLVVQVVRL